MDDTALAPASYKEAIFNNGKYRVKALGMAGIRDGRSNMTAYYLEFAGPQTAVEAMRASVHKKGGKIPSCSWHWKPVKTEPHMAYTKRKLDGTAELHYVMWLDVPELIIARTPNAMRSDWLTNPAHKPEHDALRGYVNAMFVQALNQISKVPVIPQWGPAILEEARRLDAYHTLRVFGSVAIAILLKKDYDWATLVRDMVKEGELTFPEMDTDLNELIVPDADLYDPDELKDWTIYQVDQDGDIIELLDDDAPPPKPTYLETGRTIAPVIEGNILFPPGRIVATPGFLDAADGVTADQIFDFMRRHLTGDWNSGDMSTHDIKANEQAVNNDTRVFSAYRLPNREGPMDRRNPRELEGERFWLITEADRSTTTFELPHEY